MGARAKMSQAKQAVKSLQNQPSLVCTLLPSGRDNVHDIDGGDDDDDRTTASNDDAWRKDQARIKFVPEVRDSFYIL